MLPGKLYRLGIIVSESNVCQHHLNSLLIKDNPKLKTRRCFVCRFSKIPDSLLIKDNPKLKTPKSPTS